MFKNYCGQGAARLIKRKRAASDELEGPPSKRHAGDVGRVVDHCTYTAPPSFIFHPLYFKPPLDNSRPEVGVVQRLESPIIGLKNFNNWVKSVLITRFAHPALAKSTVAQGRAKGKVLDMGCGKGGDMTKWAKARIKELLCVGTLIVDPIISILRDLTHSLALCIDIAAISVDQARARWSTLRGHKFDATFAAMDCYSESISRAFAPARLAQPFDVVSMQFCMHYAFESVQKARCMLENVTRYLRPGGIFIGTIPNSDLLL